MSKQKYTPGPWIVTKRGSYWHVQTLLNDTNTICEVRPVYGDSQYEADARLIAAAPDLLHALKGIMDLLDSGYLVRNIDDDLKPDFALRQIKPIGIFKSAIDAISKAEGLQK